MNDLYFNPDDVFLTHDGGREYPLAELDGIIYGAADTYDYMANDTYDYIDDVGGNIWGGKDEMTKDISSDVLKSNKRFTEKKWLKPTKHSALDEIIDIINDTAITKKDTTKGEKGGKLELKSNKEEQEITKSRPRVLNPDEEGGSDEEGDMTFELSRGSSFEGLQTVKHSSLDKFTNLHSINSKLELRKK